MQHGTTMSRDDAFVNEAKEHRGELLFRLEKASSASELAEFQVLLRDAIVRIEETRRNANPQRRFELKEPLIRLRFLGHSLAWRLLHPHAIRNLAKNDGQPPTLHDQSPEMEKCIATIHWLSSKGILAIAADLTHCLRIGDVVIVRDPETPDIVEFKATRRDERYRHQGRAGRQLHRMTKTIEYLYRGPSTGHRNGQGGGRRSNSRSEATDRLAPVEAE